MRLPGCIKLSMGVRETVPTRTLFAHGIFSSNSRAASSRAIVFIFIINAIALALSGAWGSSLAQQDIPKSSRLTSLAAVKFPNLTHAERAMLWFSDIENIGRGDAAFAGPSANPDDPSNDPKGADKWDHQREIRATLIRWMLVDHQAAALIDPAGVQVLGARIAGGLDISNVDVPFGLGFYHCAIPDDVNLAGAELLYLALSGSHTGAITADASHIRKVVSLDDGFNASGPVSFGNSRIDSDFICTGGRFTHDLKPSGAPWSAEKPALFLGASRIDGPLWLSNGFYADGAVDMNGATLLSLIGFGGQAINPGNIALNASATNITLDVMLAGTKDWRGFEADGLVVFHNAKVGGMFLADGAKFLGKAGDEHGLQAYTMSVGGALVWTNVQLQNGASLDLDGATTAGIVDDEKSWPKAGKLQIDGFKYGGFYGASPSGAQSRLRWLSLQDGYHPQPYRELARCCATEATRAATRKC